MVDGSLEGLEQLRQAMEQLEEGIAKKQMRVALRAGARVLERDLRAHAPVDSGLTEASILVRAMRRSRTGLGMMVMTTSAVFGRAVYYAGFVNYGWKAGKRPKAINQRKKGKVFANDRRKFIPGTRWLEKSWRGAYPMVWQVIHETLAAGLRDLAAKCWKGGASK